MHEKFPIVLYTEMNVFATKYIIIGGCTDAILHISSLNF